MKKSSLLLGAFLVLAGSAWGAKTVSVSEVLANRDHYAGKEVRLVGFVHLDHPPLFEEWSDGMYASKEAFQKPMSSRDAINLILPGDLRERANFVDGQRTAKGTFRASHGHRGAWGGILTEVTLEPLPGPKTRVLKFKSDTTHGQILLPGQTPPASTLQESEKALSPGTTNAMR